MYDINFGIILGKEITIYQIISNILFMNSVTPPPPHNSDIVYSIILLSLDFKINIINCI